MTDPLTYDQKETLHDISWNMGWMWRELTSETRQYIMEAIGGSRSLVEEAVLWADEFDKMFAVARNKDYPLKQDYMAAMDDFFTAKWAAFIAEHVANRIKE